MTACFAQLPKLIVRVRFASPALIVFAQVAAASMAAFRAVPGDRLSLTIDQAATLAISTRGKDGQKT